MKLTWAFLFLASYNPSIKIGDMMNINEKRSSDEKRQREIGKRISIVLIGVILMIVVFICVTGCLVLKNIFTGICGITNC